MDYGKLDAGLRVAMRSNEGDPGYQYVVFIHTGSPPGTEEIQFLQDLGIPNIRPGKKIITATLTAESIGALSDQSFITAIRLSRTLKPVKSTGEGW
jgi:hypothetical protein